MNTQQEVVQQSDVLNRLVLDARTAEEVGRVDQLWLDPQSHQVVGLTCKSGFLGNKKQPFTWAQIEAIGTDSLLVNNSPQQVESEKPESAVSLIGHEVWTDAGNKAGKIVDYLFVPQTGAVLNYLFASNGWRGVLDGLYLLPSTAIASIGSKRVIVPDAIGQVPQQYTEGLNQKASKAADFFKEDLKKTQTDLEALKRNAQTINEQLREKTDKLTNIAKEKLAEIKTQQQNAVQADDTVKTIDTTAEPVQNTPELPESNQ
jgi:uncharacterized protein YrrD